MCVNDYQFRHQSALRPKICKRFIFKTIQGHERVFLVNISQFQINCNLALCEILIHLNRKGLDIKNSLFHLPQFNITIEAGDKCLVPFDILNFKDVIFEIREVHEENNQVERLAELFLTHQEIETQRQQTKIGAQIDGESSSVNYCDNKNNDNSHTEGQLIQFTTEGKNIQHYDINPDTINDDMPLKLKNQQKSLEQALMKVKQWRCIHQVANLSLTNAAKFVGLPKKTLDDYFLVIRVGQTLGYDFQTNLQQKIGHLRNFIRTHPIKIKGRLPKRILSFILIPDPNIHELLPCYSLNKMEFIEQQYK